MIMNVSFWNTNKNNDINKYLIEMIIKKDIDIFILAEYVDNIDEIINDLYYQGEIFKEFKPFACKKIKILYKDDIKIERNNDESNYVAISVLRGNLKFELFSVHFPSKLRTPDDNRQITAGVLKNDVEKYERVVVVGDFNSNPFEKTMVGLSCMLSLPTKSKTERTVQGVTHKILYNPMWKFFDEFKTIPGTYYYCNSEDINYYWYIFDQVLISHDLLEDFDDNKLEIIKCIGDKSLIRNEKVDASISDHLPILFSIKED